MAMSGGIDSSVSAMLLLEQGYELVGVTFRVFDAPACGSVASGKGGTTPDVVLEAQQLAQKLGIVHHVLDVRTLFRETVIQDFITQYLNGRTPNPCVICNPTIKWGRLLQLADELGCSHLATGHYARIIQRDGHHLLATAADKRKDQTYFLWMLSEENLARTIFPLGNYTKDEVRQMAADHGFVKLAEKSESQEICFIPDNDYRRFLMDHVPDFSCRYKAGNFVDATGKVVGQHNGFPFYTIGQRKGLKVAFGKPKYVVDIDAEQNVVRLGDREDLYTQRLLAEDCRFTAPDLLQLPLLARIRYNSAATPAEVYREANRVEVRFQEPVWGVTPGQSVVFYQDDCVVGGGFISREA